ncbi:isochorismate synthase [Euhalothece natronophila Z-M001]|uniref:isochorismate synthase n=1 Tax=Euhalothece natronophila Z-M001 TaxID=522448 RepID=A0A5B8NK91_9CHRO|nr:isochorismate synthase [Euhalothece natronophila]QDZ38941.1 isochorismate synthase [Euhalothece natronophila Z-M001]
MSVTPCYARRLADPDHLHHFLQDCHKKCQQRHQSFIISVTQPLSLVEPLAILQQLNFREERSFYWETQQPKSAIAAWGICQEKNITGTNRFQQTQDFIDNCKDKIIELKHSQLSEAGLKFLTNFSFFSTSSYQGHFPSVTIFIPRWQVSRADNTCFLTYNFLLSHNSNIATIESKLSNKIEEIEKVGNSIITFPFSLSSPFQKSELQDSSQFKSAVKLALKDIERQELTKIVLAHHLDVVSPVSFSPYLSLHYLRQRYPHCYIFSVSNGEGTTFLGATPERLFSLRKQHLISDAIAGSAPRGKTEKIDHQFAQNLLASEKERREHQAVSCYIIKQLEALGLTPQRSRRQLLKLSNIQHLWTLIESQVPNNINPIEILAKLHPTPAVAGVTTEVACEKIGQYETFDRALYAAPIGWLDTQGNAEFMVGIRSAMINKNQARLYAGAGIVAGSNPDKELAEIQLKLQTMLKALQ